MAASVDSPPPEQFARGDGGELAGALDHRRARVSVVLADVLQLVELRRDSVDDLAPAVSQVGAHHLRRGVQVLLALGVAQHDPLGRVIDHAQRLAERDLGVQDVLAVVLDELFGTRIGHRVCDPSFRAITGRIARGRAHLPLT